jgi:hypothetical protein
MTERQTTERSTTGHQMTERLNSQRQNYSTSNASQNLKRPHIEKLNNETSQRRKTECRTERLMGQRRKLLTVHCDIL